MNDFAKLGIATAAVVLVAVVGINLLPGGTEDRKRRHSVALAPTPLPSPSSTSAAAFPPAGELAIATRHPVTGGGVPYTFTVPTSDWRSNGDFGIDKGEGLGSDGAGFILWPDKSPIGVFADPCARGKGPAIGPSAADLADAVATLPGTDLVSGPSDVTVGGYPAKQVVITIRDDIDCDANKFHLWYADDADLARYATEVGSTIRVWIVDVDGAIVWIDGETYKGAGPEPGQEIQQIVDSIQFE